MSSLTFLRLANAPASEMIPNHFFHFTVECLVGALLVNVASACAIIIVKKMVRGARLLKADTLSVHDIPSVVFVHARLNFVSARAIVCEGRSPVVLAIWARIWTGFHHVISKDSGNHVLAKSLS